MSWVAKISTLALVAGSVLAVPGAPHKAAAGNSREIKVATLAPRNSSFMRQILRLDKRIRQETSGGLRLRLYASGVAGDETDVIRKMRMGQLDAAMVSSEGLGLLLPEVNVLRAPGVITNYKQLEAVQKVMFPEFDTNFDKAGFKLLAWGEAGEYRYFSGKPIKDLSDIRKMRPWLWPSSPIMKETWRAIGVTPVPLGMAEVYGAIQTHMVDLVESTAIAYVALQWHHTDLAYVTDESTGVLLGGWVMDNKVFDKLEPAWQEALLRLSRENNEAIRKQARLADRQAYKQLVSRGLKLSNLTPAANKEMDKVRNTVRERMVGRIYTADLLKRVQALAEAAK